DILFKAYLFQLCATSARHGQKQMFCYYGSESQYRQYPGRFMPSNIDVSLCTHIIFAFVNVEDNQLVPQNWNDLGNQGLYAQVVALKTRNPSLKVLLAVGGWVAGYEPFYNANAVTYIRAARMDGLDMDWEFPGSRGSPPEDKYQFTKLMKTIYYTFDKEARESKRERLLLTLATAVGTFYISTAYESTEIHKYVDYMLLMTYNFHGGWDNQTAHHSTIFPSKFDEGISQRLCQTWAVNYWLSAGVPKSKIILGMTTYGMSFTLDDARVNGLNASSTGGGDGGRYTRQEGTLAYYEICENIQRYSWSRVWVQEQDVPYATWSNQWVGYDDVTSLKIKADLLINGMGLGGAFVWSLELDDFNGYCGTGNYPLLRTINDVIRPRSGLQPRRIPRDEIPLPRPQFQSRTCQELGAGTHADPRNCRWWIDCVRTYDGFIQYTRRCSSGLAYDDNIKTCALSSFCA
ncbi:unnamed protein product, partial [Candidula unifasciata]